MLRKKNACLSYTRTREIIQSAFSDFGFRVRVRVRVRVRYAQFQIWWSHSCYSERYAKVHDRWKSDKAKDG